MSAASTGREPGKTRRLRSAVRVRPGFEKRCDVTRAHAFLRSSTVSGMYVAVIWLSCIIGEAVGQLEQRKRAKQNDNKEHPGHGRCISHLEEKETVLVEIDAEEQGRIQRVT